MDDPWVKVSKKTRTRWKRLPNQLEDQRGFTSSTTDRRGSIPSRGGAWADSAQWNSHSKNLSQPALPKLITRLQTLSDWTRLSKLDNDSRILSNLLTLQSSWVKSLQCDAPVEVLEMSFDILSNIDLRHFYAKVALMKSLFTSEFIKRLASIVEELKITWHPKGKYQVRGFIEKLRTNMEFVLSFIADSHLMESMKVSIDMLINKCVETLIHIENQMIVLGSSYADLKLEIAAVKKLRDVRFAEKVHVEGSIHPTDFMNPLELEPNVVSGAYLNRNHYIETHFNLLKEDFQTVLREGVEQYLVNPKKRNFSIWSYKNVLLHRCFSAKQGKLINRKILFKVTFPGRENYFSKIDWNLVKRFMFGSLVVLTADDFNSYHLAIIEDSSMEKPDISITISFIHSPPYDVENTKFLLVEPKAFYEPYVNSMKVLKRMSKTGLPLEKYIVDADTERVLPSYLKPASVYEIGACKVIVGLSSSWSQVDLGLNPSQKEAFINALTSEMALIQGPPGTGKTFLAFKVIETILQNCTGSQGDGPIMVVCYKNHSLDQILNGLLKNGIKVLRIGSGSKNPLLQSAYNCKSLWVPRTNHFVLEQKILLVKLGELMNGIYEIVSLISLIKAQIGILNLDILKKFHVVPTDFHLPLKSWLLEFEAPHLSVEYIERNRVRLLNVGGASKNRMFHIFEVDLLSISEAVIRYANISSEIEQKLLQADNIIDEIIMAEFWKINEKYSNAHALCCSLAYGLNFAVDSVDMNLSRSLPYADMALEDRWALYRTWESTLVERLETEVQNLQNQVSELEDSVAEYDENIMSFKIKEFNPQVIGLTTTRASKHFSALTDVRPKVVIIEEAAEVLEAHAITSITNKCQHLILIGDHQQLKPSTASYELATQYHMDMSLFERMIKNDMKVSSLAIQHRMRPEISALICPSIYKNLANHPSVLEYPDVKGTKKNLYFFDHKHLEETDIDSESKSNPGEAEIVTAIAYYLWMQGYSPKDITILSTYMDQNRIIKKIIGEKYGDTMLRNVVCTVVDSYQGEENIIILLSLVRSNHYGGIGFLKTKNRICVALSRAKYGLFIFGNMSCLTKKQNEVWDDIEAVLAAQDAISKKFPLKCVRHGNITEVASPEEVVALKNGGCINPCGTLLSCSHTCRVMCHALDLAHKEQFACRERCLKKCENGHTCSALCKYKCPPCSVVVPKLLVCGHTKRLKCHSDNAQTYCSEVVKTKLEPCGHEQLVLCRLTVPSKRGTITCQSKCETEFSCGHVCKRTCHVLEDPDHEEFKCKEPCERINESCPLKHKCKRECQEPCGDCLVEVKKPLPCGHVAKMDCSMEVSDYICRRDCPKKLACGHYCADLCSNSCGLCGFKVEKFIEECGHKIKFPCSGTPTRMDCYHPCRTVKSCLHKCSGKCSQICEDIFCKTLTEVKLPCGHSGQVPCGETQTKTSRFDFTAECEYPCQTKLPCGHRCKGTCGSCLQGRVHVPCDEVCDKLLVCNHKCQVLCSNAYHSCVNKKCFKTCWSNEINCPPSSFKQGSGKNRIEFNPKTQMANEMRWALNVENGKMMKLAQKCNSNKSIILQVKHVQLCVNKLRTINVSTDDDGLLTLRTSLFQVEFVSNVLRIIERLESAQLPTTKTLELDLFLEKLVVRSTARPQLGTYEMTQLQEQFVWVSLVLDVYDVSSDYNIKDRMLRLLAETKMTFGPNDRVKIVRKLRDYSQKVGIPDLVLTDVELKGSFPAADKFCGPISHHAGRVQERERPQKIDEDLNELVNNFNEMLLTKD